MKWRVMLELGGPDGTVVVHEVPGRAAVVEYAPQMIGLTLADGKQVLAGSPAASRGSRGDACRAGVWRRLGTAVIAPDHPWSGLRRRAIHDGSPRSLEAAAKTC
jgi:hypothetical protein